MTDTTLDGLVQLAESLDPHSESITITHCDAPEDGITITAEHGHHGAWHVVYSKALKLAAESPGATTALLREAIRVALCDARKLAGR